MHAHGDGQPHEHHGGARGGLAWDLLDSIILGAFVIVCGLLAELAYKSWRARRDGVRYDLTPEGLAASGAPVGTEPGCTHPLCKLDHPHAGPAILREEG